MESEQPHFLKSTMNYGLITGLVLVVYSFIIYIVGQSMNDVMNNITLALLAVCIYLTTKHFRDKKLDGYLSYGRGLGVGTLTGVFAAVLLAFFLYLQIKFIDPGLIDKQLDAAQVKLLERGLSEDEVEKATILSKKLMTPGMMFITSIVTFGLYSFIISLITSAFLKKIKDPFASQMDGIDNN